MSTDVYDSPVSIDHIQTDLDSRIPLAKFAEASLSRRHLVKAFLGVAAGAALHTLGLLPFVKPPQAGAAKWTYYLDCQGYFETSTICTPTSAYYFGYNCTYIPGYDPHGYWHRDEGWVWNGSYWEYFSQDPTSCNYQNAWTWAKNYRSYGYNWQCSDGYYASYSSGAWYWGGFSICRSGWA
jgi:hypothetical protein